MRELLWKDWKFRLAEAAVPELENLEKYGDWRPVRLPHDWSTDYSFDEQAASCGSGGYVVTGYGWYYRKLYLTEEECTAGRDSCAGKDSCAERNSCSEKDSCVEKDISGVFKVKDGKQLILFFEGVYMDSTIYVNGHKAGGHVYGYTSFEVDITDYVVPGENEILVTVDNSRQPGSRWYSGSGITRDVWLERRSPLHIARYGVYVTSSIPAIEEGRASLALVSVKVTLQAPVGAGRDLFLTYKLTGPFGERAASGSLALTGAWQADGEDMAELSGLDESTDPKKGAGICAKTGEFVLEVLKPLLWSVEEPNLYTLKLSLYDKAGEGQCLLEERSLQVGLRSIAFDPKKGFWLNGERVKLNGVCVHHDGGSVGAAVPIAIWERRFKKLKDMGVNSIRCSHNPPDSAFLDLCDREGFLVMDEAFDEWRITKGKAGGANTHESQGYSRFFEENYEWDLKSMLYRDRNHPSIILWSIGNEIPEQVVEDGWKTAARLKAICKAIDPTRKITLANDQIVAQPHPAREEFLEQLEVVGYNYVGRWRERAETFYDEDHERHPDWCLIGTENPSAGNERNDYRMEFPYYNVWTRPYYSSPVAVGKLLRYTMTHDFVAGDYMWTGIDYLGEAMCWPGRSASMGCLDTCGFEKDAFYFYKSVWNQKKSFAYLCPHWNLDVSKGQVVPVLCYTNCEEAELFLNGRSLGKKYKGYPCYGMSGRYDHYEQNRHPATTDDLFFSWDVPYEPGCVEVIGFHGGEEACRYKIETAGNPVRIEAVCDKEVLKADDRQIAQIEIRLLDAKGRVVPHQDRKLTYELKGNGRILGIDNGHTTCHELWKEPANRSTYGGMAFVILQAGEEKGELYLKIRGAAEEAELTPAEVVIQLMEG